jgi:hypothetical protein
MLSSMDENGQAAVSTALRNFQHYGEQVGATASVFGKGPQVAQRTYMDEVLQSMLKRNSLTPPLPAFDAEVRRRAGF